VQVEGTDLIYEGITTPGFLFAPVSELLPSAEGTDLIYEGITTTPHFHNPVAVLTLSGEGTDLIYEGITTTFFSKVLGAAMRARRN
jgi:hypothetical protein